MRVMITGGAGFLGSQLGWYLSNKGHSVVLLDDLSFGHIDNLEIDGKSFGTFIQDDVRSERFIDHLDGVDVVFHFAAIAPLPVNQVDPQRAYSVNVAGWGNVLEACRRKKVGKVILASTSAVYENNHSFPVSEGDFISPYLTYSLTKKHAEELGKSYGSLYGMDITVLRFFNVYGPHHDFRRKSPPLIAYIIKCLMTGEVPVLHSDGSQERDYVYVSDLCDGCELAMGGKSAGEIINLASNSVISMTDIYGKIAGLLGSSIQPKYRSPTLLWDMYSELGNGFALRSDVVAKETNKFCQGSYDKAKNLLGWEPKTSFDDGIKATVEYAIKTGF